MPRITSRNTELQSNGAKDWTNIEVVNPVWRESKKKFFGGSVLYRILNVK